MPHVGNTGQIRAKSEQTRGELKKNARPSFARDNLSEAFAGNENKGPSGVKLKSHSTNVKSRKTKQSKEKTPKR